MGFKIAEFIEYNKIMRLTEFSQGEHYHLFNHGVDQKKVFLQDSDFQRFLISLVTFNAQQKCLQNLSYFAKDLNYLIKYYIPDKRDRLVDIISFTLLPTHFHLFIREKRSGGTSQFMHKLNMGYARYFNLKYKRKGSLWRSTFGASHVASGSYFVHIISYIHLNILDLYFPEWRQGKIEDWEKAKKKLRKYPWSSYSYYRDEKDRIGFMDLILTKPDWMEEYYPEPIAFEENLQNWSLRCL